MRFFLLCHSVIGALIGKQEGRNIEVMNSFELLSHTIDDRVHIDKEYYYTKEEQCEYCIMCQLLPVYMCALSRETGFSFILHQLLPKNGF